MSAAHKLLLAGASEPDVVTYVDDLFSTFLYTGNGGTQTFNNGVDLAAKGGLIWTKSRSGTTNHVLVNTVSGLTNFLNSNNNQGQGTGLVNGVTAVSETGYSIGNDASFNTSGQSYAGWTFAKGARFFDIQTKAHVNGIASTIDLSVLGTVGMAIVKRTDAAGDWMVWHRSQTAGRLTYLNLTSAETVDASLSISGTTLTLAAALATGNYLIYAWAHDTANDGMIQCGSYAGTGAELIQTLGFEPQYLLIKNITSVGDWYVFDPIRGMPVGGNTAALRANLSDAEAAGSGNFAAPTATGFILPGGGSTNQAGNTYIYMVIRRQNKPPTSGAQVYEGQTYSGNATNNRQFSLGFTPDMVMIKNRNGTNVPPAQCRLFDRLRGDAKFLEPESSNAEVNFGSGANGVFFTKLMNGFELGNDSANSLNVIGVNNIIHAIRRAPGFMEEVCDTGTGAAHAIAHNLGVTPELVIRKSRSGATQWEVWHSALANTEKLVLNSTAAKVSDTAAWNSTSPSASSFTVGTGANVNTNGATYVTCLFATLVGISKVGSYTGNGGTQPIDCGFAAGARFILVKRIDAAGDWYVWDSTRGIVAGLDPHLSLNTTEAEVTTDDSVDPTPSGFIVNQNSATNINVLGGNYVFLSVA